MPLSYSDSAESTCTVLTCTSLNFRDFFQNERLLTEALSDDVLVSTIRPNRARLRAADPKYRLDDLLIAMLKHAPHPLGKRYVAVCLHIAHRKGVDGVVDAARAWLHNLILPSLFSCLSFSSRLLTPDCLVLAITKADKTAPANSQTPTIETTMLQTEGASRKDQSALRASVSCSCIFPRLLAWRTDWVLGWMPRTSSLCNLEGI
jgi:hypothetical protein